MKRISVAGALAVCAGLTLGCGTMLSAVRSLPVPGMSDGAITQEELHDEVLGFASRFSAGVSSAANAMDAYWFHQVQGEPDAARDAIRKIIAAGIPMPIKP